MKNGTVVALCIILSALVGGVSAYVLQAFVYYHRATAPHSIRIGGSSFAVENYVGLEHPALPLRLRGCFKLSGPAAALAAGEPAPGARPFGAPFWFRCWNAHRIDSDLKAGLSKAVIAETQNHDEIQFQRIVVIYPDGRAYQWRRWVETRAEPSIDLWDWQYWRVTSRSDERAPG